MNRLLRAAFGLVPARWRAIVERDLAEEAEHARRRGLARELWLISQAIGIAVTLRIRLPAHRRLRGRGDSPMTHLRSDIRMALRALVSQPRSAAAIVLTLALGISATTTVYAVFNHLVFRPMPGVHDVNGLVTVLFQPEDAPRNWSNGSAESVHLFRTGDTGLLSVAAWSGRPDAAPVVVRSGTDPRLLDVELVAPFYLETLGVRARLGRLLTPDETREPGHGVALISDALWRREFGAAADVLGHALAVNGRPFTIVGVVDTYRGWGATSANTADIWLPEAASRTPNAPAERASLLVARAQPGVSVETIQTRLRTLYAPLREVDSNSDVVPWVYSGLRLGPGTTDLDSSFPLVAGIAGLLTLLACANAANLLLARTRQRRHGLTVRAAIGASRWRLMRPLIIEVTMLAAAAVVGGVVLALATTRLLEGVQVFSNVGALAGVGIDWRVAAFASAIGATTVLVAGLAPIVSATRVDLRTVLQEASRSTTGSQRFRQTLVAVQLALSVALMMGAGVLVRSQWNLRSVDLGMHQAGVFSFTLNPRLVGLRGAEADALLARVVEQLRSTPGIRSVAHANPSAFLASVRMMARLRRDADRAEPGAAVETTVVSPAYFDTLGVPLLAGRTFDDTDDVGLAGMAGHVGIINASLARVLFGEQPAVGQRVTAGSFQGEWKRLRDLEIVGVVGDTKTAFTLRQSGPAMVLYEPLDPALVFSRIYVRSELPPDVAAVRVYESVRRVEPRLPLVELGTLTDEVERLIPEDVALARLLATVAGLAVFLGFAGVYAVTTHYVGERTREFGVRIALGATRAAVVGHAGRGVGVAAIAGVVIGLGAYTATSRIIAARLYDISPLDLSVIGGAITLVILTTAIAVWLPARRATRIDPAVVLREG